MDTKTDRIRALNDALRQTFTGGRAMLTPGVAALGQAAVDRIVKTIAVYDDFCQANDPYGANHIDPPGKTALPVNLRGLRREEAIPTEGHKPLTTESEPGLGLQELRNEAATAPVVNRTTLPYYRPLSRGRARLEPTISEAMIPDAAMGSAPSAPLPDVAAASFGETSMLEAIIGNDDRVRVADNLMRANPWRQICALRIRSKTNKMYVGTGWFIAPRVLGTAGHCVFLQNEGGWAQSTRVNGTVRQGNLPTIQGGRRLGQGPEPRLRLWRDSAR